MKDLYNPQKNRYINTELVHHHTRQYHENPELNAADTLNDPLYKLDVRMDTPLGYDAATDTHVLERTGAKLKDLAETVLTSQ